MAEAKKQLTEKQKRFCEEYIFDWNATRAYQKVYPDSGYNTAKVNGSRLLTNANIQEYINEIKNKIEELAGISKLMIVNEHKKLATTSIAQLHNTWIERKQFEALPDSVKDCISEIQTQIKTTRNEDGSLSENEFVKVKMYDKQKSLEAITKLMGYNEADKVDLYSGGKEIKGMIIK